MSSDSAGNAASAAPALQPFVFAPVKTEKPAAAAAAPAPAAGADKPAGVAFGTYEKGLADGEARARADFEKKLVELRAQMASALQEFKSQRDAYFEKVESEVVQLALSIARKILHREAQVDPLLLAGVVRVALESLHEGTRVRLRTHPDEIKLWRGYFGQGNEILPAPEFIGDPSLAPGNCVLETELGATNIGLETQMKEIEQGFLDLLEQRPRVRE